MTVCTICVRLLYAFLVAATFTKPVEGFLFRDFIGDNDSILFPHVRSRCTGFEIGAFESYPKSFRDDSIMELAQAGHIKGHPILKNTSSLRMLGHHHILLAATITPNVRSSSLDTTMGNVNS